MVWVHNVFPLRPQWMTPCDLLALVSLWCWQPISGWSCTSSPYAQ